MTAAACQLLVAACGVLAEAAAAAAVATAVAATAVSSQVIEFPGDKLGKCEHLCGEAELIFMKIKFSAQRGTYAA